MEDLSVVGRIAHIYPNQANSPTLVARVLLDNPQGSWSPGLLVEGVVLVEQVEVDLMVDNDAIQLIENSPVVFVQEGNRYFPRQVVLGRSDDVSTEVLAGLSVGERYVIENSYLIKADLEKEGIEED